MLMLGLRRGCRELDLADSGVESLVWRLKGETLVIERGGWSLLWGFGRGWVRRV